MNETVMYFETLPPVSLHQLYQEVMECEFFQNIDFAVDYGDFPDRVWKNVAKDEKHIGFIFTFWHKDDFPYIEYDKALDTVHKKVNEKYYEKV